ncbi:MAG: hypothetical protein ACLTMR_09485 [Faecalibacillus sp.]
MIQRILKLDKIIRNNSWVEYYSGCGAELDLWIDFEENLFLF